MHGRPVVVGSVTVVVNSTVEGGAVGSTGMVTVGPGTPGGPGGPGGPTPGPRLVVGRVEGTVGALPRDPVVGGVMEGAVRVVGVHPSVVGASAALVTDAPTSAPVVAIA